MMDFDIVKMILANGDEDISQIDLDKCAEEKDNNLHPLQIPLMMPVLAKSLAKLLCHKVSPAAHQRYLVRTNIIEQIRDWSRITSRYAHLHSFTNGERTTKFTMNLVEKYLTKELIMKQSSVDGLVKLGSALINMKLKNSTFKYKLDDFINRILYLNKTDDSEIFMNILTDEYENLSLSLTTIENIYIHRAKQLIEIPIVDYFILYNANSGNGNFDSNIMEMEVDYTAKDSLHLKCSQLFKYSSKSPCIFQLLSSIMKEIFTHKNCCKMIVDFIQFVLNHINKLCEEQQKKILDLYPRNLQCAVILLRIEPNLHTNDSKAYTIQILKNIYSSNTQEFLTLLTHFPLWIEELSNFSFDNDILF